MRPHRVANSARFQDVCLTLRRPSLPPSLPHAARGGAVSAGDLWSGGHDAHDVVELHARGGGGSSGHFKNAASLLPSPGGADPQTNRIGHSLAMP